MRESITNTKRRRLFEVPTTGDEAIDEALRRDFRDHPLKPKMTPEDPDDTEPEAARTAELRAAYEENIKSDRPPYAGVSFATRGELLWVMREREWSGAPFVDGYDRPDLRQVDLSLTNLHMVHLSGANLSGSQLFSTDLSGAWLHDADLTDAALDHTDLRGALLSDADLSGAWMEGVDLREASLNDVALSGTNLQYVRMNVDTVLDRVTLNSDTKVGDIVWDGVPLTRIDWNQMRKLGDDPPRWQRRTDGEVEGWEDRWVYEDKWLEQCATAIRANRQIALELRQQGLNEHADRFAYHAHQLQRLLLRRQVMLFRSRQRVLEDETLKTIWKPYRRFPLRQLPGKVGAYTLSLLLDGVAGYGYRTGRTLFWYFAVIVGFAWGYFQVTHGSPLFGLVTPVCGTPPVAGCVKPLQWYEALVLSVSSFHGRGFYQPLSNPGDPVAVLAAAEAVLGLFIEISFVATFVQRFFGAR